MRIAQAEVYAARAFTDYEHRKLMMAGGRRRATIESER